MIMIMIIVIIVFWEIGLVENKKPYHEDLDVHFSNSN